jgi:hypothetical protein
MGSIRWAADFNLRISELASGSSIGVKVNSKRGKCQTDPMCSSSQALLIAPVVQRRIAALSR